MNKKKILFCGMLMIVPWLVRTDPVSPSLQLGMISGVIGIVITIVSSRFVMVEDRQRCETIGFSCLLLTGILTLLTPFEQYAYLSENAKWLCILCGSLIALITTHALFFVDPIPYQSVILNHRGAKKL